ncbi:MAG: hypothetical protein KDK44_01950 [Chlamydiia bacterium]|nr:hypothetical protein [Chlamydiia bacterium]MCP5509765.1 hypothetical protein [Chlamydiales bacterium]
MRVFFALCCCTSLIAADFTPWFTGSLLSLPGHVVGNKKTNYQPYLYYTKDYGFYDNKWRKQSTPSTSVWNPQLLITRGFGNWFDFKIEPQMFIKSEKGQTATRFGDFPVVLGFQALNQTRGSWIPDLRITLRESFPSGHHDRLNPAKLGTGGSGSGSYETSLGFNFQRLEHLFGIHYFRWRLNLVYTIPSPTHVDGFNVYGGGFSTNGTIYPGNHCFAIFAFEYNFNQNWVLACDFMQTYGNRTRFSGKPGRDQLGNPARIGSPSSDTLSIAPALEYNFSKALGIIGGVWFSARGRNSEDFISYVLSVNYFM